MEDKTTVVTSRDTRGGKEGDEKLKLTIFLGGRDGGKCLKKNEEPERPLYIFI